MLDYIVLSLRNRQESKSMRNVQNLEDTLFDLWNFMLEHLGIIPLIKPTMRCKDCTTKINSLKNKCANDEKIQPFHLNSGLSLKALFR